MRVRPSLLVIFKPVGIANSTSTAWNTSCVSRDSSYGLKRL